MMKRVTCILATIVISLCVLSKKTYKCNEVVDKYSPDIIYAILLDWPGNGLTLDINALGSDIHHGKIASATLLSVKQNYNCPVTQHSDKASIFIPSNARRPSDSAHVIRLTLE